MATATAARSTSTATQAPSAPATVEPVPPAVPQELAKLVGRTFDDGGGYDWRIEPSGDFLCVGQRPGKPISSVGARITKAQQLTDWQRLSAMALAKLDPQGAQKVVATPAPVPPPSTAPETAPPPASTGFSLVGFLDSLLTQAASFLDIGSTAPAPEQKPTTPTTAPTEETDQEAKPDDGIQAPTPELVGVPALSQYRWYGPSFEVLGAAAALAAANELAASFQIGAATAMVTPEKPAEVKKPRGVERWWFTAEGVPASDGKTGTQYFDFKPTGNRNSVSLYLASNPPGTARPGYMTPGGGEFSDTEKKGFIPVPAAGRDLALRNIPASDSCFATSQAMIQQAGQQITDGSDRTFGNIVTNETYEDGTTQAELIADRAALKAGTMTQDDFNQKWGSTKETTSVEIDVAQSEKTRAYIDWECERGNPVMTGVTYTSRDGNNDNVTDHWVLITSRSSAGYKFNDPARTGDGVNADDNVFVWADSMLKSSREGREYIVSWVRPNVASLKEWDAHWAELQQAK